MEHETHEPKPKKVQISLPAAIITGSVIIAISLLVVFGPQTKTKDADQPVREASGTPTSVPKDVAVVRSDDRVLGNKNAEIAIIEYSDSDCPFCARFHDTMEQVVEESNGDVAWVYRYLPLDMHPNAYTEALSAECVGDIAGNDAYWNYLGTIMDVTLSPDPKSNEALIAYANKEGVSNEALKACLADANTIARVDRDYNEAQKIGARGTPFSIAVNTKTGEQAIIPGAYPVDEVKQIIESIR